MSHTGLRIGMVAAVVVLLLAWVTAGSPALASISLTGVPVASLASDTGSTRVTTEGEAAPDNLAPPDHRPNVVFILTDDLDVNLNSQDPAYMPRIKSLLTDQGTTFANHFVSLSLCCPSRASTLTGEYAHNTDVFGNAPPFGGFDTFHNNHNHIDEEDSTIGTWLQAATPKPYRTALMGKYLNGYPDGADPKHPIEPKTWYPPHGWDVWDSPVDGAPYGEFNYTMNENGKLVKYRNKFMVDILSAKAKTFIGQAARDDAPFFLYLAPYDPHQPAAAPARYQHDFVHPPVPVPQPPSFDEKDVSDKPDWIQALPPLSTPDVAGMTTLYDKRLQAMEAVEDMVQTVVDTLAATHQLDNTYIFFASDNGFHMGEHRLPAGKNTMYEEDLHVPLIVRGPGVAKGRTVSAITANIDYAPTFADIAGATAPTTVDGRSLVPLLHGATPPGWRNALLLEHGGPDPYARLTPHALNTKPSPLEPPDPMDLVDAASNGKLDIPPYVGVRTADLAFAEYDYGATQPVQELYNLRCDPYELTNIASDAANKALVGQLSVWSRTLHACSGANCRSVEAQAAPASPLCPGPTPTPTP